MGRGMLIMIKGASGDGALHAAKKWSVAKKQRTVHKKNRPETGRIVIHA